MKQGLLANNMAVQRLTDSALKVILLYCFLGALCVSHSLSRPTNSADPGPRVPADLGIARADPLVEGRGNSQVSKLRGKGKVNRAAVSYLFF